MDSPYRNRESDDVPVWIAIHQGEVIGQMALQLAQLTIDGTPEPAGWIVDVMIHADHRGQGLGHKIHDAIKATGTTLVTLTMAAATRRIAERAGCVTLGAVHQMIRPSKLTSRTITSLVSERAENRPRWQLACRVFNQSRIGPWAVAQLISGAAGLQRSMKLPKRFDSQVHVRDVLSLNLDAADMLSRECGKRIRAMFDRQAKFCDWRFNAVPDLEYRFAECGRDDKVTGLAVWRLPKEVELPVGTLTDVIADPEDHVSITALVRHAVSKMSNQCEAIIAGASHPTHIAALSSNGFVTVKIHRPTVVTTNSATRDRIDQLKNQWHFTKADHDWDQVHPVET